MDVYVGLSGGTIVRPGRSGFEVRRDHDPVVVIEVRDLIGVGVCPGTSKSEVSVGSRSGGDHCDPSPNRGRYPVKSTGIRTPGEESWESETVIRP